MFDFQIGLIIVSIIVIFFEALYLKLLYSSKKVVIKKISLPFVRTVHVFTYSLGLFYIVFSAKYFLNKPVFEYTSLWFILVSLLIVVFSRIKLGIHYSPDVEVHKNHKYIKDGIYTYISHPVYYAEIIAALFTCFLINHPFYYFVGFPLFFLSQLIKIKAENLLLQSHFPVEYETQADKINKLFVRMKKPFLSLRIF